MNSSYLKTTIGALSSCSPDFVLLIVGANAGIVGECLTAPRLLCHSPA